MLSISQGRRIDDIMEQFEPKPSALAKIARYSVAAALAVAALLVTIIGLAYGPLGEFVRGYDAIGWYGICVPKNTPTEVVNTLNEATNVALAEPKFKARLADLGVEPMPMTSAAFGKFMSDEAHKWSKVIKFAGIKPD